VFLRQYDGRAFADDREQQPRLLRRHCFVDYVRHGQIDLLTQLMRACGVDVADVACDHSSSAEYSSA